MTKLEDVEGINARAYLKQMNKRLADIEKRFASTLKSEQIINLTLSNRIEALEKKGK